MCAWVCVCVYGRCMGVCVWVNRCVCVVLCVCMTGAWMWVCVLGCAWVWVLVSVCERCIGLCLGVPLSMYGCVYDSGKRECDSEKQF